MENNNIKKTVQIIDSLIKSNRLPHAFLLNGGTSSQRIEIALHIASAFVCTGSNNPCGICNDCNKIKNNIHPDVITIDPIAKGETIFKVDVVREMRADAYIIPNEAKCKVYILNNADKMNPQAQNALLKIIEEPPTYAKFILLCESDSVILETIISRVAEFDLGDNVEDYTDELNREAIDLARQIASALILPTELELLRVTAVFENKKELFAKILKPLSVIFRDAMLIKVGSDRTIGECKDESKALAVKLSLNAIIKLIEIIDEFNSAILRNANKTLLYTRFSSQLRTATYTR